MRATRHGESLIQVTRFPLLFPINCYLVREDDGFTLIDTGLSGSAKAILAAVREQGESTIQRIALTHAHGDHAGSLDALRAALPSVEILIPARDARFLRGDRALDPGEPAAKPRGTFPTIATRATREPFPGDHVGSLVVIAAPGHTPGQVAYFDPRDRTLIAGDAFQTRGGIAVSGVRQLSFPFPAFATWHLTTALTSARALRALDPARLAVGHGDVLEAPLASMDRAIATAERTVAKAGSRDDA